MVKETPEQVEAQWGERMIEVRVRFWTNGTRLALTLDVYSHVTPTMHDEAAATIDRLLASDATA